MIKKVKILLHMEFYKDAKDNNLDLLKFEGHEVFNKQALLEKFDEIKARMLRLENLKDF